MPRVPIPLVRYGGYKDAEKMFILSYEGTHTEKKYFADFRISSYFNNSGLIEIIPLERPNNSASDPLNVKKLLKKAKSDFQFKKTDEFWLIIDRDDWQKMHHIDFEKLYEDCKKEKNFYLALSNPCFEIWLLAHLIDISLLDKSILKELNENRRISNKKNFIDIYLGQILDVHRNDGKTRGYNKTPDPRIFIPRINDAIKNARLLDKKSGYPDYPRSVGSHVYKLIEKLMK